MSCALISSVPWATRRVDGLYRGPASGRSGRPSESSDSAVGNEAAAQLLPAATGAPPVIMRCSPGEPFINSLLSPRVSSSFLTTASSWLLAVSTSASALLIVVLMSSMISPLGANR